MSVGGGALGLIMGGLLTEWASWRWVMFVNVPIGLAVILVGLAVLPETQRHRGTFDLPGAVFSTLGMAGLVYGFVRAASDGWTDALTLSSFVGGAVLLTAFVLTELRAEQPITPLRLFNDRSRTIANVARGLLFGGMFGLFFFLTQFLQDVLGYSALKTGFAFLPLPVTVFLVSQLTSRVLIHRVHAKVLMVGGVALGITGFALGQRPRPLVVVRARARQPAAVRRRQRPVVRAAHPGGAGGCPGQGRRRGLRAGQRHPAARWHPRGGHPGDGLRPLQPAGRHRRWASRRLRRRSTCSPWERHTPSWRRHCSWPRRSPWLPPVSGRQGPVPQSGEPGGAGGRHGHDRRCRSACRRAFARFPQIAIEHQRRRRVGLVNSQPQPRPGQADTSRTSPEVIRSPAAAAMASSG